jgi:hypothetical protein
VTQDELDQTLEQFKEQFGDKPRYILLSFSESRTVVLNGIFGNIYVSVSFTLFAVTFTVQTLVTVLLKLC